MHDCDAHCTFDWQIDVNDLVDELLSSQHSLVGQSNITCLILGCNAQFIIMTVGKYYGVHNMCSENVGGMVI